MNKRAAKPKTQPTTDNPDFEPVQEAPATRNKPPSVIKVAPMGFSSFEIHLSNGEILHALAAGNGSNALNAMSRDVIVDVLQRAVAS